ncbi:hypothetical protein ACLB2K_013999 [Fragaria x ananassa]
MSLSLCADLLPLKIYFNVNARSSTPEIASRRQALISSSSSPSTSLLPPLWDLRHGIRPSASTNAAVQLRPELEETRDEEISQLEEHSAELKADAEFEEVQSKLDSTHAKEDVELESTHTEEIAQLVLRPY